MSPTQPTLVHVVTIPATISLMRGQLGFCANAGLETHVVASFDGDLPVSSGEAGVMLHSIRMTRSMLSIADLISVRRLVALLKRLRPEIVQAGTPKAALLGMLAARLVRAPIRIYHIRGLAHMTGTKSRALAAEAAERACCALATHVLCVSESVRQRVIQDGFCAPEKVSVLLRGSSNGVDAAGRFDLDKNATARVDVRRALEIPLDAVVIGFVGRLVRDKGIESLFEAWLRLREEFPAAMLLLVGPFEEGDAVSEQVRRGLESDSRVRITQTAWGEAAPLYAAMDLVAFPSLREGFPNVPMEAAAMQLPVVAARSIGTVDAVVDGETGLMFEPRNSAALADALASLLRDPGERRRLGLAGRERALSDYRPEDLWAAQVAWYDSLLTKAGLSGVGQART